LKGKTAIITGATAGIGRATALLFAREGAPVVATGRNRARGEALASELGGDVRFIAADVRIAADCRRVVDETIDWFGRVDVLFNNAGVLYPGSVVDLTEEAWDETIDTSVKGAFLMSKYAVPHMIERGGGAIINMGSEWSITGGEAAVGYCAAKAGVLNLTRAMAIDHGPQGIRVNCICPGDVDTPMLQDEARKRGIPWEVFCRGAAARPLGRVGTPEEIAKAVLFLATDDSSFMTGAALVVDGGGTAG